MVGRDASTATPISPEYITTHLPHRAHYSYKEITMSITNTSEGRTMTPREIHAAVQDVAQNPWSRSDRALVALHDLLVHFIEASSNHPSALKALSMDQIRFLNQLHLAVGR